MCGIVGVVAERNVVPILLEGLRRLEYRGYDSAGMAVINSSGAVTRLRTVGKVRVLQDAVEAAPLAGHVGIAHTRWATHGVPTSATPTRTSRATASRSCTTASSRITRRCAPASSELGYSFTRRPTPRSSRTASTIICELERSVRGRAQDGRRARGRLRARGGLRARSRGHRARARGLSGRHRPRHRREFRRLGRRGAAAR